jgi:hypothetical protein
MDPLLTEHWKMVVGLTTGAMAVGVVITVFFRDGMRKWLLNNNGGIMVSCPLVGMDKTPLSKEDHDEGCDNKMKLVMAEMAHLKEGQQHVRKTVDKILDRLDIINNR